MLPLKRSHTNELFRSRVRRAKTHANAAQALLTRMTATACTVVDETPEKIIDAAEPDVPRLMEARESAVSMSKVNVNLIQDREKEQESDPKVAFLFGFQGVQQTLIEADMAQRTGLEPATPGVTGRYSNRLNYRCASAGLSSVSRKSWWLMTGSNRRPPACDAGALPAELISRSPCEARNLRIAQHQVNTGIEFFASGRGQVALVDGFCAAAAPFRRKTVGCTGLFGLSAMCIQPVAAPAAYHRNARVRQQTNNSHARHRQ